MLKTRNELFHLYDMEMSRKAAEVIRARYAPLFKELDEYLKKSL